MSVDNRREIVELRDDHSASSLYSEDLAPVPAKGRTWNTWNLAAIWVGMAVCIPTYILASYMIASGVSWWLALVIIGLANLVITVPMVLNGHAGVRYGIPFPVLGRASFGTRGIHVPAVVRALVACGWFGVQTWIGGLAIWAILCELIPGFEYSSQIGVGNFITFLLFWLLNIYFIWRGTESIKWLETYSAPILVIMGLLLIGWGASQAGGFGIVLEQSRQLQTPTAVLVDAQEQLLLKMTPLEDVNGHLKADEYRLTATDGEDTLYKGVWTDLRPDRAPLSLRGTLGEELSEEVISFDEALDSDLRPSGFDLKEGVAMTLEFRQESEGDYTYSSPVDVDFPSESVPPLKTFLIWLTGMVGFWATMSLSISDITRYARSQKEQVMGQFIGLPPTMILYSFVGIFVTCAAVINFKDILVQGDAPWDPVSLLARFESPVVVIIAQLFMIVATLSTNIAANVIAPANAFANLAPRKISFAMGGTITGIIGILIMPWLLLNHIASILILVSGFLGPILGIMLADYYTVRKTQLNLDGLYQESGPYAFGGSGFNFAALAALGVGVALALVGYFVPEASALKWLYSANWFIGFAASYGVYVMLMREKVSS